MLMIHLGKFKNKETKMNYLLQKKLFFQSPYDQYAERNGQPFEILYEIKGDPNIDPECLPMYKIKFQDGTEMEVWPEEIFDAN